VYPRNPVPTTAIVTGQTIDTALGRAQRLDEPYLETLSSTHDPAARPPTERDTQLRV